MLSVEVAVVGVGGAVGLALPAKLPLTELFLECFIADCLGGDGARVEDECVPLVKSRDIEAVAVDVPASATGAGVRGKN